MHDCIHRCTYWRARWQGHAKTLDMNALWRHASLHKGGFGFIVHLERATDINMVDLPCRQDTSQERTNLFAVHHAMVQGCVGVLVRKHMLQHQARHIAVLEVFDFLFEHGGLELPVAIDKSEPAQRFACQHGLHGGQDGRDTTAACDADVVPF